MLDGYIRALDGGIVIESWQRLSMERFAFLIMLWAPQ